MISIDIYDNSYMKIDPLVSIFICSSIFNKVLAINNSNCYVYIFNTATATNLILESI